MTETTREERNYYRPLWDNELSRLVKDADRLDRIEAQVIYRTSDMPKGAAAWMKDHGGDCAYLLVDVGDDDLCVNALVDAPDLMPDTPGPVYRAIVNTGEKG